MIYQGRKKKNMNITRHISLEEVYSEKLKPSVEKHNSNFGAAIRDMAFGNKAQLSIRHLISRGDKYCEVVIRMF